MDADFLSAFICVHLRFYWVSKRLQIMQTSTWTHFPCTLDNGPAANASIGLIALASDIVIEPELHAFLPHAGIGLYTNRIPMPKVVTVDTLRQMGDSITAVTTGLVPDDHLDVIIYGCTSGSMTIGPEQIAAKIRAARPDVAVTDPITAGSDALCGRSESGRRTIYSGPGVWVRSDGVIQSGWRSRDQSRTTSSHLWRGSGVGTSVGNRWNISLLYRSPHVINHSAAGRRAGQTRCCQQPSAGVGCTTAVRI